VGLLGDFKDVDFHPSFYRGFGLERLTASVLTADVLLYAYGSRRSLEDYGARGTPVIVIDEGNSPCISPDLLALLQRPEVRLCFRRYGFRDTASYFRAEDYYEEAHRFSVAYDSPPDHFPVCVDDPMGNAVRKIQVRLPVIGNVGSEWPNGWSKFTVDTMPDISTVSQRRNDILFIEEGNSPRTKLLRDLWEDLPAKIKYWTTSDDSLEDVIKLMQESKIFLSAGLFSSYDFYAISCGCVVVKPECSNVFASIDIFDPLKSYIRYCDIGFKDLFPVVSAVLGDIGAHREGNSYIVSLFNAVTSRSWGSHLRKMCQDMLCGRSRLGDVSSSLPLV
jgi:hypothetical protein